MSIHLGEYLRCRGFSGHPFTTRNAAQEEGQLPSFFVQVDWFERLVDSQSLLLFAPKGYGKTCHRIEIARRARERLRDPVLVVSFTGFDLLLQYGVEQLTTTTYLDIILRMTLEELDTQLRQQSERERAFRANEAMYARFYALLTHYAPDRAIDKWAPPGAQKRVSFLQTRRISAIDSLKELAALVGSAQYSCIYFLIDGIDEWPETQDDPMRMIGLLRPLLGAPGLLQDCGFAFKFFLPQELMAPVIEHFRADRFLCYSLSWSEQQLLLMLSQRLTFYSRLSETSERGRVEHFQDLCDGALSDIDGRLVRASSFSPRKLIELANAILDIHCRTAATADELISGASISQALGEVGQSFAPPPPAYEPAPPTEKQPRIFVNAQEDIFLGGQPLKKPLPKYLKRCMRYLWDHRDRLVSSEELIAYVYKNDPPDISRGDPKESLVKIIRRLREAIEPADALAPSHPRSRSYVYIDGQFSTGYVLRHFVESQKER